MTVTRYDEFWPVTMSDVERIWCDDTGWHLKIRLSQDFCMIWSPRKVKELYRAKDG